MADPLQVIPSMVDLDGKTQQVDEIGSLKSSILGRTSSTSPTLSRYVLSKDSWNSSLRAWSLCCLVLFYLAPLISAAEPAKSTKAKPAVLQISGYGFLGNRVLKRMLRTVELAGGKPEFFGPTFVEDSALILTARVKRDGFLKPIITIRLQLANRAQMQVTADDLLENPLPRHLRITKAQFHIQKGVLYYYENLVFSGLQSIPEKQARSCFLETETLFHLKSARIYTPERLERGISSLIDTLDQKGYQNAKARAAHPQLDDNTGAVTVQINVEEGPKFMVQSVRAELLSEGASKPEPLRTVYPNKPYSKLWLQDFTLSLKTNHFKRGFPDTTVTTQILTNMPRDDRVELDLLATIKTGPQVRISAVEFQGYKKTKPWLLKRRVRIQ